MSGFDVHVRISTTVVVFVVLGTIVCTALFCKRALWLRFTRDTFKINVDRTLDDVPPSKSQGHPLDRTDKRSRETMERK